jgi:uncharacterized membrane protein HdeD (DUF308 family)
MHTIVRPSPYGSPAAGAAPALTPAARHAGWRAAALRGIGALVLGLCALAWPEASLALLLALLTGYSLFAGGAALTLGLRLARAGARAWPMLGYAILALAVAAALAFWPRPATLTLVTLFAAWMVAAGAAEIALALRLRGVLRHVWPLAATGLTSLAFAWVLLAEPSWAVAVAIRLVGIYALVTGAFLLGMALRLWRWHASEPPVPGS